MHCTICKSPVLGKYCSNCGQNYSGKRLTVMGYLADLMHHIVSLESPIIRNLHKQIVAPSFIANNYFEGNRGYYFSPAKLLFYAMLLVAIYLSIFTNPHRIFGFVLELEGVAPQLIFVGLLIPFLTISSVIVYSFQKQNFTLQLVGITYAFATTTIFLAVFESILRLYMPIFHFIEPVLPIILLLFTCLQQARIMQPKLNLAKIILIAFVHVVSLLVLAYSVGLLLKYIFPNAISL